MATLARVAVLGPADPLPYRPSRVVVAGTSGSGKTTLAGRIGQALGVPHIEIDALFHGPAWTPRPSFVQDVHRFGDGPCWVTEWQYSAVRQYLAERADLVVWLDLPRALVLTQVVRRTVVRRLRREALWNGNLEPPLRSFFSDPDHIVRWAWKTHAKTRRRVLAIVQDQPELPVVRLKSHRAAQAWLAGPLRAA